MERIPRSYLRRLHWSFQLTFILSAHTVHATDWTSVVVKNVTRLGPQITPQVTDVSRDGGSSVLVNGNIVWLYDDTECLSLEGDQLSFVSNTAAYAANLKSNVTIVHDFGIVTVGKDKYGNKETAILANYSVGDGGWVPFNQDELDFNNENVGKQRVAIWPGSSPTPISTKQAFLYAPLVYVDSKPQDPTKMYQPRGMTLINIKAPNSGPQAVRMGDLIFPGNEVAFGGFATLLGYLSTDSTSGTEITNGRDIYLFGVGIGGLQLSRVNLNDINDHSRYTYFDPQSRNFTTQTPELNVTGAANVYLPDSFSSGTVFFSPYYKTFLMVYFNKMVDSTFYIRYLDLETPLGKSNVWGPGGKNGKGIRQEDAEAIVWYAWSQEQTLYVSPTGPGGFNYAGTAHPEYFNQQYYASSLYPDNVHPSARRSGWYGASVVEEANAGGDGRHLLLSWSSQNRGGFGTGLYQIQLAKVEFGDIPANMPSTSVPSQNGASRIIFISNTVSGIFDVSFVLHWIFLIFKLLLVVGITWFV
ncbi:MAG: hypothetical protein M1827_002695 [Pycnora praestabilis]|nr:MAG: hypothetical protein M1827_002695 [Pycnora praestabilis]